MDPSLKERIRGRRARSHTSQETLIKDSSSDVSPRESVAAATANRRRQRRAQRSPSDQQHDNQAFAEDERPLPPPIERTDDDDEEEEENIQNADRLVSHVAKQHRRIVNEVQQQNRKSKKKPTAEDADKEQEELHDEIREQQQEMMSRHGGNRDDAHLPPSEPLAATTTTMTGTIRDRSIDQILEMAKKSRTTKTPDDELQTTLGSSRRFAASSDLKLQKMLNAHLDASRVGSPSAVNRPTRFDYRTSKEEHDYRDQIDQKQEERTNRWKSVLKHSEGALLPSDRDDFFLKVWPEVKPETHVESSTTAGVTTADNMVTGEARTTDEAVTTEETNLPEEKQPLLPPFGEAQPAQYQRAERALDEDEQRDFENEKYKYVVGGRSSLEAKLGAGIVEPRSLEEEGIFVGRKPVVPINLVHRAEKRLLEECAVDQKVRKDTRSADRWFGPDGAITSLPDPTKFVPTRPLIDDFFDPALGKEFYKAYKADNENTLSNNPGGANRYRLDIDLGSVTFLHHHLMSVEHVLAMKMKQMYEHYTVRKQQRIVQQLSDKIKALKSAENNCRTLYEQNQYSESSLPEELRNRLINYQNELRQTRNQRCNEMKLDRQLLTRLLDTWKKIKDVRRTNGYTTTPVRLIIKQVSARKTGHYEKMQQQIEEEIDDEVALANDQFQREKAAYDKLAKRRRLQIEHKKVAKKRIEKKRDKVITSDNPEGDYAQADIDTLNEEDIQLPEKPEARKADEIRTTVLTKYQNAIRPADEPDILLELVYSEPVSTDSECTARERARRHHVQTASNILARILINGKVMVDTPVVPLSSEFEARFSQIFPCYVVRTPETIKIELYEFSARFRAPLAELYLPIPEATVTSENYKLQAFEFSSNILRQFNPNQTSAVGAGIPTPIQFDDLERIYLNIEGVFNASVAWGVLDGVVLVPADYPTSKAFQNRQMAGGVRQDISMQAVNLSNMKNLIEWIKQSNLDPYDPENAFLINLMKDYMGAQGDTRFEMNALQHFRLWIDENDETEQQRKQTEIDTSLRFKLIQARKENIPDFRDYKAVPPYDYLVRKDHSAFKNFMARGQEAAAGDSAEQHSHEKRQTRIDAVRRQGERQLRKMREQVLARFALTSGRKSYHQMVVEETVPNIQALRGILASLYIEPNRPLYPTKRRTEQKKVTNLAIAANRDVYILVNLIGAIDLPIRREQLEKERQAASNLSKLNADRLTLLRPYVEIEFQKKTYRTSTVDGPNPSWNEELRIPFRPPDNDFDAISLQRCRDILYINIFDELDVDLPTTDRERGQIIRKRIAKNWLGSVKIPFSNIYVNGRLEGSYRISVPNPLLGYTREKLGQLVTSGNSLASVLRMFVTMEPILAPPETIQQSFDSTESLELLNHARNWVEELNKKYPDREYKATVADINGRAVFIPRFLRPLPLPSLTSVASADDATTTGGQIQSQRLARFVSLIPFLSDTVTFPGICDIWETSDQFLKTMAGDDEEHAVLLNNYFLTLNKKSYIAMGVSIYSGPCSFVLTIEDGQRFPTCWSVSDGNDASTLDTWNPICSIYLLANEENIWANIQDQDLPSRMNFDVTNSKQWRPFFDRSFTREALHWTSVQPTDLHYESTRMDDVNMLAQHISEVLREKIFQWRESSITRIHYGCQKILQNIVRRKETEIAMGRVVNAGEPEPELTELQKTHEIIGFPLQMPYSTMQTIVDAVFSTKMFQHATNDIEFALAVHVHPYPNNILAVWIYLAHLIKKTS